MLGHQMRGLDVKSLNSCLVGVVAIPTSPTIPGYSHSVYSNISYNRTDDYTSCEEPRRQ